MKDTVKQSQYDSQMKELSLTWVQTETSGERTFELAQELKELKTILNYIVNEIPDIIYRLDTNGSITFVNDAVRAYGYIPGKIIGRSFMEFVHPGDRGRAANRINERRTGNRSTKNLELRFLKKKHHAAAHFELQSGSVKDYPIALVSARGLYMTAKPETKSFIGTLGIVRDITEREKQNHEVFAARLLSIIEEEKKKLSYNLHDEFGNMAVGLSAYLKNAEQAIRAGDYGDALLSIKTSKTIFKESLENCKRAANNLCPHNLETTGLQRTLNNLFSELQKTLCIKIRYIHHLKGKKLNSQASIALYRIAQEALSNTILHAQANLINVRLYVQNDRVFFTFSDDGRGFAVKKVLSSKDPSKMGLRGMKERVDMFGEIFSINSGYREGTKIVVSLPDWEAEEQ